MAIHQFGKKKKIRMLTSKVQGKKAEELLHITDRSRAVGEPKSETKHP